MLTSFRAAIALALITLFVHVPAYAQTDKLWSETYVVFLIFIAAVVALSLYVARDAIFRKKTDYDHADYASKHDKTADKYGSSWQDDYETKSAAKKDDWYIVLGLERTATDAEIKTRYKKLAKMHHPDRTGGSPDDLARINKAYEILSDPESRRIYDKS